jgi:chromate transporter
VPMPRSAPARRSATAATAPLAVRWGELAAAFGRVGLFGFGGGPSFIPLIQREVEAHGWLTKEEFLEAFAFGNALPGPIATKLAGYVGFRVAGWSGAGVALLALTGPSIVAMVALAALYVRYQDADAVVGFLTGLRPVVIALLVLTVLAFVPSALGAPRAWRGQWLPWCIAVGAFLAALTLGVHPGLLILAGGIVGLVAGRSA